MKARPQNEEAIIRYVVKDEPKKLILSKFVLKRQIYPQFRCLYVTSFQITLFGYDRNWSNTLCTGNELRAVFVSSGQNLIYRIGSRGQFNHHFTSSFYASRAQKRKKDNHLKHLLALSGSACIKAAHKHVGEINPWISQPSESSWTEPPPNTTRENAVSDFQPSNNRPKFVITFFSPSFGNVKTSQFRFKTNSPAGEKILDFKDNFNM